MQHNGEVKKMKTKQVKKETMRPIKPFKTIAEEAEYGDTHSILDDINEGIDGQKKFREPSLSMGLDK